MSRSAGIQENAADGAELELADQLAGEIARERTKADREQLATYPGRAWVWDRLEGAGIFRSISGPIEQVYQALGRREPGLELLARCQEHPELFFQMWNEALKRRKARAEHIAATRQAKRKQKADDKRAV